MQNIIVGRYQHPETRKHWQGWIEPDDRTWIAFVAADGRPVFYLDRDPETGACIIPRPDENITVTRIGADGLAMGEGGADGPGLGVYADGGGGPTKP